MAVNGYGLAKYGHSMNVSLAYVLKLNRITIVQSCSPARILANRCCAFVFQSIRMIASSWLQLRVPMINCSSFPSLSKSYSKNAAFNMFFIFKSPIV